MDAISDARQIILENPWVVVAVVILAIILIRGRMVRSRARIAARARYDGPPKDGSEVPDPRPMVAKARRQMIMALIALAVVAILVIMQNLH